jgi:hypothetical protein
MKTISAFIALAGIAVLVSGCATAPASVIPQANGTYQVIGAGASKKEALDQALASADSTCAARKMRFVVKDQKAAYSGVVDEGTNKMIDTAAGLLQSVKGSVIPTLSGDDDYQMTLTFSCES